MNDSAPDVVAFGELLMRLDVSDGERFVQARTLLPRFTGGEANVAVALAQLGVPTEVVSRVPEHAIGQACINALRQFGVGTRHIGRGGERLGLLFVESGASQRGTRVIYDRLHTSLRTADPAEFDWPVILHGARWLHVSGTAPALGDRVNSILDDAFAAAKSCGTGISFDCSYRSALWGIEQAGEAFRRLARHADLLFASREDCRRFFGIDAPADEPPDPAMEALRTAFSIGHVVFSERRIESAGINHLQARISGPSGSAASRTHRVEVVDRIGSGDALAAGVLFGLLQSWPLQPVVEFAAAAAVLAHTIPGDFNLVTRSEIEALASGSNDGDGRIHR